MGKRECGVMKCCEYDCLYEGMNVYLVRETRQFDVLFYINSFWGSHSCSVSINQDWKKNKLDVVEWTYNQILFVV